VANTLYHVRAYATTSYGTTYGDELTFTTLCGTITSFPWNEGFENGGTIPTCWSQQNVTGTLNWTFRTGSPSGLPAATHTGTYNASFYEGAYGTANVTKLITPSLNLSSLNSPVLKFWHAQPYWSPDQDELRVYYRTSATGTWNLLATYTNNLTAWTQETITLPAQSSDFYIAFEGTEKWGYGITLDDVSIIDNCGSSTPVSVAISASANNICQNTSVTFTATPTNGGTTPSYQWKVNGGNVGSNSATYSYSPANGDVVTCVLTSNASCTSGNPATSNSITMTVNPALPVSVSISASGNNVCTGTSVNFTATATNGGKSPAYQWIINGTAVGLNSSTYGYIPANGDVVTCVLTSNASCTSGNPATSNSISMTVNPLLPVSININPSGNNVCSGTSITFTATATNGGTSPVYKWNVNGGNVGTNSTTYSYTPANGDMVSCILTSNATCASGNPDTSNMVTVIVLPAVAAGVNISASNNNVCANTAVSFTATAINGGTAPVYQWKVNGSVMGTNTSVYTYSPANNDAVTCVMTSNAACVTSSPATSNTVTMSVNSLTSPSISIAASFNSVCAGTTVNFTATATSAGPSPSYQWKVNGASVGSNYATYSYVPVNNDAVTCVVTSNALCPSVGSVVSNTVSMIVNPTLTAGVSISASANNVCQGTSVTYSATATHGGALPTYQWKVNGNNAGTNSATYSYSPANGDVVYCTMVSNASCANTSPVASNSITMAINTGPTASLSISSSANPVCSGTTVTFTATPSNGGSSPAYQWKVNGQNAGSGGSSYSYVPNDNDAVTCMLTSSLACISGNPATSNTVTMDVNPGVTASISITPSANNVNAGTPVTFTAIPSNGGASPAFQWKLNGANTGINSPSYTYTPENNDAVKCVMSSNAPCLLNAQATSNTVLIVVNNISNGSIILNYEDIAISSLGQRLLNRPISIRFSILSGSASGPAVYVETQTVTTNSTGIFSLPVGSGNVQSGSFNGINWAVGSYFLKVEMDADAGSNYTVISKGPIAVSYEVNHSGQTR